MPVERNKCENICYYSKLNLKMAITSDDIVKLIEKALDDSTILLDLPYF